MKKKMQKQNSGFSLIEVMIVLSILSVFSIFLVNLIITTQNAVSIQNNAVPVRAEAKQTMEAMVKELREADLSAPGGITIGGTNNSQITFNTPNQVSQTTVLSWRGIQFSHDSNAQQVIRTENGVNTILGRNVQSLQFGASQSSNAITASIVTSRTTAGGANIQATLNAQIKPRN